jgi:L-2,4-diaminobutyrate decarboxylase
VDAAHGAGALMSEEHRPLLSGIERADSVVIDFHKMFLVTGLNTLVLFRDQERSYETFDQSASYLFEEERKKEWYNGAKRTLECTKSAMGFIAYTGLLYFRKEGYKEYIDKVYALAKSFAAEIQKHPSFELAVEPESNIVCFRYVAAEGDTETQNRLNAQIRKDLLSGGHYYIVQTMLGDKLWLRTTLINPLTEFSDLTHLLDLIPELI